MQRILVVDDERLIADTLAIIFNKHGFHAVATYSAEEALVCARGFWPDLLLCDISMPIRDGLDLMKDISQEHPNCRILVLTGNYSNLKRVIEQASQLVRPPSILTKPCLPAELLREAGAMLARDSISA
jgi:DNA-binding response OmpR family regulator